MISPIPVAVSVLLSLATVAFASPPKYGDRKCGNHLTAEDIVAKEGAFSKLQGPVRLAEGFSNYTIPVYFHVVSAGDQLAQGSVP
jgi:hypothetical protein